jgi:transposase
VNRKYHVTLSENVRTEIQNILNETTTPKNIRKRCNVLLMADETAGKVPTQEEIAVRCGVSDVTVYKLVKEYATQGIATCLRRRTHKNPPNPPIVTGEKEARIIALACGEPPEGFARWSIRLLRDKVVELQIVDSIGRETIRTTLKKHNLSLT